MFYYSVNHIMVSVCISDSLRVQSSFMHGVRLLENRYSPLTHSFCPLLTISELVLISAAVISIQIKLCCQNNGRLLWCVSTGWLYAIHVVLDL